jgi:hypothetical protein
MRQTTTEPAPYQVECHDDDGRVAFTGRLVYCDGGLFGIRLADGSEREHSGELTHVLATTRRFTDEERLPECEEPEWVGREDAEGRAA